MPVSTQLSLAQVIQHGFSIAGVENLPPVGTSAQDARNGQQLAVLQREEEGQEESILWAQSRHSTMQHPGNSTYPGRGGKEKKQLFLYRKMPLKYAQRAFTICLIKVL